MNRLLSIVLLVAGGLRAQSVPADPFVLWLDLSGEWRLSSDDRADYAAPGFDDSGWATVELPTGRTGLAGESNREQKIRWFRKTVAVPSGVEKQGLSLTLGIPANVYELYVNGRRLPTPTTLDALEKAEVPRPRTYPIPEGLLTRPDHSMTIAIRHRSLRMAPNWRLRDQGPYLLTSPAQAPTEEGRRQLEHHFVQRVPDVIFGGFFAALSCLTLVAWLGYRQRTEFLWLGLLLLMEAVDQLNGKLAFLSGTGAFDRLGGNSSELLLPSPFTPVLTALVLSVSRLRSPWWRVALWGGWSLYPLSILIAPDQISIRNAGNTWCSALGLAVLAWDWWELWRKGGTGTAHWLRLTLLFPFLAVKSGNLAAKFGGILGGTNPALGSYSVGRTDLLLLPVSIAILLLLIRQVAEDRREQQRLTSELESARTIQQLLFPVGVGGPVEAVYLPASEVGGDFWQDLPTADGRARIVAVGDVSGKGLQAAMVVSLLTGALRNRKSDSPAAILGELNCVAASVLKGGFVTAVVARIEGDAATIASAGHPSPYLAGAEVALEPGLPLGIYGGAEYVETRIGPGPLTFVSDGVLEAANVRGELFGFDRTREMSGRSAAELAEAAKAWGQNDDITVVTVRRAG